MRRSNFSLDLYSLVYNKLFFPPEKSRFWTDWVNTEYKKGKVLNYSMLVLGWVKVIFLYPAGIPFEDSALDEMMEVDG